STDSTPPGASSISAWRAFKSTSIKIKSLGNLFKSECSPSSRANRVCDPWRRSQGAVSDNGAITARGIELMRKLTCTSGVLALVLTGWAQALGLGEIYLRSALNEPLRAEIALVGAA